MVKLPHIDSNIPCTPVYGVYISQLVTVSGICDNFDDFNTRHDFNTKKHKRFSRFKQSVEVYWLSISESSQCYYLPKAYLPLVHCSRLFSLRSSLSLIQLINQFRL